MTVTEGRILDLIAEGCSRYKYEGTRGIEWVFDRSMTSEEKVAFDLFLVRTGDQLAWEPGTVERRFKARIIAMVEGKEPVIHEQE